METKIRDKRRILLVLPLLVMPFLALAFYAGGGGKGGTVDGTPVAKGISTALPDAEFRAGEPVDKMGFYEKGAKDTAGPPGIQAMAERMGFGGKMEDDKAAEINARLAELQREISSAGPEIGAGKGAGYLAGAKSGERAVSGAGEMKSEVDRLEMLMKSISSDREPDPEMEQMNSMLEKLLDIQNPARGQQKAAERADLREAEKKFLAVPAEIAQGGKVVQGSTVSLRLLDSVVLKKVMVPKGHLVFGLCRLVNQRLMLEIKSIRLGSMILPVELTMYSLDGMPGLEAKDAVLADAASSGAVDAVGGISVYGMDGLSGQVAGAGLDAAKSLFSRKVKVVRVKLRAGQQVLLRNNRP